MAVKKITPKKKKALKHVEILWAEGDHSNYDKFPKKYPSFLEANKALEPIARDFVKSGSGGYNKTKFQAVWADGNEYTGRLDISEKDDNPLINPNVIGTHISDFQKYRSKTGSKETKKEVKEFFDNYSLILGQPKTTKIKPMATKKTTPKKTAPKKAAKKTTPKPAPKKAPKKTSKGLKELVAGNSAEKVAAGVMLAGAVMKDKFPKEASKHGNKISKAKRALLDAKDKPSDADVKKSLELLRPAWIDVKERKYSKNVKAFYDFTIDKFKKEAPRSKKKTIIEQLPDTI